MKRVFLALVLSAALAFGASDSIADSPEFNKAFAEYKSLRAQKRFSEAEAPLRQALELVDNQFDPEKTKKAMVYYHLGVVFFAQGKVGESVHEFRRAIAIASEGKGPYARQVGYASAMLARAYTKLGRPDDAEELMHKTVTIMKTEFGEESKQHARELAYLGFIHASQGRHEEALPLAERVVEIYEALPGTRRQIVLSLTNLRRVYEQLGRSDDVAAIEQKISAMR